jgi:DNA (cytosine-5)-methyltransferase 1
MMVVEHFKSGCNMLGGKSVNGVPVLFPYDESVPYHLYWQVLNAKHHGVPQNRERVFLIGIRDDADNRFQFPREEHLTKRLKDVLEDKVDEKYFLDAKIIRNIFIDDFKVKSATFKGYEQATIGDSINFSVPTSETRRGRVGKGVAQTLDTGCNQGVIQLNPSKESKSGGGQPYQQNRVYDSNALCPALSAGQVTWGGNAITLPNDYRIRRLTPRECFRLMDFPDTFTWPVSDSQAYKQAGNSIVVNVLYKILKQLPL